MYNNYYSDIKANHCSSNIKKNELLHKDEGIENRFK